MPKKISKEKLRRLREGYASDLKTRENLPRKVAFWADNEFKADDSSIGFVEAKDILVSEGAKWLRVGEIPLHHHHHHNTKDHTEEPIPTHILFQDDIRATDIRQGLLGDCYFLSALASLCEHPSFLRRLFVQELGETKKEERKLAFDSTNQMSNVAANGRFLPTSGGDDTGTEFYNPLHGELTLRFCVAGKWQNIPIDDRFVCISAYEGGVADTPAFSRMCGAEIWVLAIEKAYAKLYGSYANIEAGVSKDALFDLTGCPAFRILLGENRTSTEDEIWKVLSEKQAQGTALCASVPPYTDPKTGADIAGEHVHECGLVHGHAYTVLSLHVVQETGQRLLRLRNPWGRGEWKGEWSDNWSGWTSTLRRELHEDCANDDGEFYIPFEAVLGFFDCFEGVVLGPSQGEPWHHQSHEMSISGKNSFSKTFEFNVLPTPGQDVTKVYLMFGQQDLRLSGKKEYVPLQLQLYENNPQTQNCFVAETPLYLGTQIVVFGDLKGDSGVPTPLLLPNGKYTCVVNMCDNVDGQALQQVNNVPFTLSVCCDGRLIIHDIPKSSIERPIGRGNMVTRLLRDDFLQKVKKMPKQEITDQTDPKFIKQDLEFPVGVCFLFSQETNPGKMKNGKLKVTATVKGENFTLLSPDSAKVLSQSTENEITVEFTVSSSSTDLDGFFILVKSKPASFEYSLGFEMGISAGGD
eukprot:g4868.t1